MTDVLLCVGNSMMGDDGAGPLLAEKCAAAPKGNWVVIDGGSAPENDIVAIRELRSSSFSSLYTQSTQCTAPFADCPCTIGGKNIQVTGFTNIKNEQFTLLLI